MQSRRDGVKSCLAAATKGGAAFDEARCRREKSTLGGRLRPMPRRRRWLLAVLEDLIGLFRGKHLLVSNRDASYLKYLKCGAAAQAY